MNKLAPFLAAWALAAWALPAAAQTLKPGLWEVRSKVHGNPEMDAAMAEMHQQMAAMPPEQRKQMQAMMARQGMQMGSAPGGGTTMKMCLTREMAERNEITPHQGDCKTTRQSRSGSTWTVAFACTNPPSTGESQVTMASPEAYTMRMTSTTTQGGRKEKLDVEGSGKWLGADCGSIKPMAVPRK